jgi:response regulator RpfG family c-di-GMP phosphodiesterase
MQRHSDEGARIIDRLGFLTTPCLRYATITSVSTAGGYPDGLKGGDPLGARIIHVADASTRC